MISYGKHRDWHVPSDWAFLGWLNVLPAIGLLAAILLRIFNKLESANLYHLYWSGLGLGVLGIAFLFFARLPLYRQGRFLTFGPKALPLFHRKLYWLAYSVVAFAVFLLGMVWLRTW